MAPFLIFFVGAVLAAITTGRVRAAVMLLTPVVGAVNLYAMPLDIHLTTEIFGRELVIVTSDRTARLFGWLFHLSAFVGGLYSLHTSDRMQHVSVLAYAGCAMGVVFAGDLLTVFLFWEGLALTSIFLVLARRTASALRSAVRYLLFQVASGMLMLLAIILLHQEGRGLDFAFVGLDGLASWLLFIAIGIKAGFPLLHNWITDSYPEATETGAVVLSAFTTKVAIFALLRMFPGTELLIWIGAAMATLPIFYAVIEHDLRRVLSYSLINQLGFMVVGIGIGTELALNGAVAHAYTHVMYKSLLFMAMGAVLYRTGRMGASELGGLHRTMPVTTGMCMIGAASISAFPFFSGFISKSMILSAALYTGHDWVWIALLFASAGVFLYVGIKVPFFAFFARDSGLRPREAPVCMLLAMGIAAFASILIGVQPQLLYAMLPYDVPYNPYSFGHVLTQCQLLLFSALAFVWLSRTGLYPLPLPGINIDAEWLYRRLLPRVALRLCHGMANVRLAGAAVVDELWHTGITLVTRFHGPRGVLARNPLGSYAMITLVVLFAAVLVLELVLGYR